MNTLSRTCSSLFDFSPFFNKSVVCLTLKIIIIMDTRRQYNIIGRAGASPPSRTAAIYIYIYIYMYLYPFVRRALNLLRSSFSPIFQYFSAVNDTRVSFPPIFHFNIS